MDIRTGLKKSEGLTGAFDFFFSCRSLKRGNPAARLIKNKPYAFVRTLNTWSSGTAEDPAPRGAQIIGLAVINTRGYWPALARRIHKLQLLVKYLRPIRSYAKFVEPVWAGK